MVLHLLRLRRPSPADVSAQIHYFLVINRQGKIRLSKWFDPYSAKDRARVLKDIEQTIFPRQPQDSNFVHLKDLVLAYRRYASVYFIAAVDKDDNMLLTLETIHRFCVLLDMYFGRVSELDLIFNFDRAYLLLDNFLLDGRMQETSSTQVISQTREEDVIQAAELMEEALFDAMG